MLISYFEKMPIFGQPPDKIKKAMLPNGNMVCQGFVVLGLKISLSS